MSLRQEIERLLDARVLRSRAVAGGDLNAVLAVDLDDGRSVIVKSGSAPRTEAEMLQAISARAVAAPEVLAHNDRILVLEMLPAHGSIDAAWRDLGDVLGRLHGAGPAVPGTPRPGRYGWHVDYAFGDVLIENAWADDWAVFWAERRLASHLPFLPRALAARVAALRQRLSGILPADPEPSLLHGDLWRGNVVIAGRRVCGLIDPACYYGDREVDLAMLHLFDIPGPEFHEAYGPLSPDAEVRKAVYQLWPALVHLRLFGTAYLGLVERCLGEAGV